MAIVLHLPKPKLRQPTCAHCKKRRAGRHGSNEFGFCSYGHAAEWYVENDPAKVAKGLINQRGMNG
jgi:hypothetical protein